ncbi:hypothetical protein M436DRAFT_55518 [Aureobasidium namibiae CBS 147.97]|uniref:Inhibitor I9 domain-containing protein n=1 Tax=Aureobasidium namibiae CBS 147.97 TaxID=1043004 RepID=A0A074WDV4_9PEZI
MQLLKLFMAILSVAARLQATHTLLPPSEMHPIEPPDLDWHLAVFTPPDEYLVYLKPGYTISQHLQTIGKDLSPHIRRHWEDFEIFERAHYIIYLPDQTYLDLIRRDPEVSLVIQNAEYQAISDPVPEELERGPNVPKHDEL